MKKLSLPIDPTILSKIIKLTFERLPEKYGNLAEGFFKLNNRKATFFRESVLSSWIGIPVSSAGNFKEFDIDQSFTNIFIETTKNSRTELRIHVSYYGIIGVHIGENLEDLITENIDTTQFQLENVPTSKFCIEDTDLEYFLDEFEEIDDYLDDNSVSAVYLIENVKYYSIITFSDRNCIALNVHRSVFLLNKISGHVKLIAKRPQNFIKSFLTGELSWLENYQS